MSGALRSLLGTITVVLVSISVLTYILALAVGLLVVTSSQLGSDLLNITVLVPVGILLYFVPIFPSNLLILVDACIIIYGFCFWAAARGRGGFLTGLRNISTGSRPKGTPNWLVVMPLVGSSLLIVVVVLTVILDQAGLPIGNLNIGNPALFFASLTYAPIEEEMAFRISILGLLVGLRAIWKYPSLSDLDHRRSIVSAVFWAIRRIVSTLIMAVILPERAKERANLPSIRTGGWRGVHWTEWILLSLTSIVFGLAHSLSGSGWGPGKALTAGLPGFVLGLVYLAYGPYADILLHWFFNFYLYVFTISTIFTSILIAATLLTFTIGVLGFLVGIAWLVERHPVALQPPMPYMPQ